MLSSKQERKSKAILGEMHIQILESIKRGSKTEKKLSKELGIDLLVLSPIITDLIMAGHVEMIRRKRFVLFSREYCVITIEGLDALQRSKNHLDRMVDLLRESASAMLNRVLVDSMPLRIVFGSFKTVYKIAELLVR